MNLETEPQPGSLALLAQPDVRWGAPVRDALVQLVAERKAQRILPVVTGSLAANATVVGALTALGDAELPAFTQLRPHTPFEVVLALMARMRADKPDMVVVFGGGSAIDAVKIACTAITRNAQDYDGLLGARATLDAAGKLLAMQTLKPCTVVAVPTTLSAAEFGIIAGATDTKTGIKHAFQSDNLAPDVILYDPWLAAATPQDLWLSTGIRAVDHAIETVFSIDGGPLTDALALQGLTMLAEGLNAAHQTPGNAKALHTCQMGAWLAGTSIGRVRYGASHGLGHQLGAVAGVPHGLTSCVLLPAVLDYNAPVTQAGQTRIAQAMGRPDMSASDAVRDLIAGLGLPTKMLALGVERTNLQKVAETALGNLFVKANPRPLKTAEDVMQILNAAY